MWINKNKYLYEHKLKDDKISQHETTIRFLQRKIKSMEAPVQENIDFQGQRLRQMAAMPQSQQSPISGLPTKPVRQFFG